VPRSRNAAAGPSPDAQASTPDGRTDGTRSDTATLVSRGRLLVTLAAVLWSSSGLFAKATTFDVWPSESRGLLLAFWRALFAGLLLLPAVRQPRWDRKLIALCITFAVMNVTYLSAMTLTTAANAIWLQSTAPWWVLLVGVVILGEPFPRSQLAPLAMGGLGLAVILAFEMRGQNQAGVLCGMVSGLTYAGVVLALRSLRGLDTVWIVALALLFTATCLFPYVVYLGIWPTTRQLPVLAGFGMLQMAVPYVLFGRGLRAISSQEATVIGLLEPILLPIWVYLVWHETPDVWTIVGGGLILAGLLLRYGVPLLRAKQPDL
jgi:DME family drug/metabolite transporter